VLNQIDRRNYVKAQTLLNPADPAHFPAVGSPPEALIIIWRLLVKIIHDRGLQQCRVIKSTINRWR
jgi:hypothetical protein